jgi:hypothetical protein
MFDPLMSPMQIKISFNKLLGKYEKLAKSEDAFSDLSLLDKYEKEIGVVLQDFFNPILTQNEIKRHQYPFKI